LYIIEESEIGFDGKMMAKKIVAVFANEALVLLIPVSSKDEVEREAYASQRGRIVENGDACRMLVNEEGDELRTRAEAAEHDDESVT
jgi:hypothetical protein